MIFETFEDKFNKQQKIQKTLKEQNEFKKRKSLFNLKFPNIIFKNLKLQNEEIETDDNSTHYLDIKTNIVYSYNYNEEYWYICDYNNLNELFD